VGGEKIGNVVNCRSAVFGTVEVVLQN